MWTEDGSFVYIVGRFLSEHGTLLESHRSPQSINGLEQIGALFEVAVRRCVRETAVESELTAVPAYFAALPITAGAGYLVRRKVDECGALLFSVVERVGFEYAGPTLIISNLLIWQTAFLPCNPHGSPDCPSDLRPEFRADNYVHYAVFGLA